MTLTIYINSLIGQAVSEKKMFEYYGQIHVYSPGAGADNPLQTKFFHKHKYSVYLPISCKFCPYKSHFINFSHSNARRPMLTLP